MTLEQRLAELPQEVVRAAVHELAMPTFNPREHFDEMPYLKGDDAYDREGRKRESWVNAIIGEIRRKGVPIATSANTLYGSLNKEVMKRVYYGLRSMPEIPPEFMAAIHEDDFGNWMELYFAAGKWEKGMCLPQTYESMTLADFVASYIRAGMGNLNTQHYRRRQMGEYSSNLNLPFDSQIRRALNRAVIDSSKKGMPTIRQYLSGEISQSRQLTLF